MRLRRAGMIAAGTTVMTLLVVGCSSHDTTQAVRPAPQPRTVGPSSTQKPSKRAATTTTTSPPALGLFLVARARNSTISVYPAPDASQKPEVLPNPWIVDPSRPESKVVQVFLIRPGGRRGWLHVLLPVRPNGSTGWVRADAVSVEPTSYHVQVQRREHVITVFFGTRVVYAGPIAVGKPSTPTPTGTYYIRVLMKAPNPNTVYGPYAYGLSSHSDVLSNFNGGDGEIGIHGNDDASVLGHDVTHGCIRMDNAAITRLTGMLPLGTPVDVVD
jgi:lipoprotein-anchoring transpeptidase ErfK/SrfK